MDTRTPLHKLIENYEAIRTANATGFSVEQVKAMNNLERQGTLSEIERTVNGISFYFDEGDPFGWSGYGLCKTDGKVIWR